MVQNQNKTKTKPQEKSPETDLNEMNISYLPDRMFKITIVKMFIKTRRTMHEQSENVNKENSKKYKIENI